MDDVEHPEVVRDPGAIHREIDGSGEPTDVEHEKQGEPIREPFDPEKIIDVVTRNPTVNLLLSRIRKRTIDLAPDFQRNAGIWTDSHQSRLIESLLLRIPLPTLYAAENPDDSWAIVDGIQRLTAIARFMDPEPSGLTPLTLQGLEYLEFDGFRFADLPGRLQTRLEETEVVLHLIRRGTPEEVKFNIFARINTGGVPLSAQELRHALIPGRARDLLAELARTDEFLRATSETVGNSRMADREMVLRFMAFLLIGPDKYQHQDLDSFLREAMKHINTLGEVEVDRLRSRFVVALDAARGIFGRHAFRKRYTLHSARYPINKALFETVTVSLARRSAEEIRELIANRREVNESFVQLMVSDPQFERAVSVETGDVAKVRYRFRAIDELFNRSLAC